MSTDAVSWWLLASMAITCLLASRGLGFIISPLRAAAPAVAVLVLWLAKAIGRQADRPRLTIGATAFLQMTLFTVLGVVLSYILTARSGPLWDGTLANADFSLGLNWPAIFHVADRMPILLWAGGIAYHSLTLQMVVCIVVLSVTGRDDALRLAVAAAISSGFVTIGISGLTPALGNVFDPAGFQHLWPSVAWSEHDLIIGLRDGSNRVLDLSHLMGIVTFPSYHATLPVILAWAQRGIPRLRVIASLWASVTILCTPLFGGHYGVDVLAGLFLASLAIATARPLVMRKVVTRCPDAPRPPLLRRPPVSGTVPD